MRVSPPPRPAPSRKRGPRRPVPHTRRPHVAGALHVTLRLRRGLPGLRRRSTYLVVERAMRLGGDKPAFRVYQFSVLNNHLHLVVEACNRLGLSRGMQGLAIRIAKNLNRHWGRTGSVFAERYFARWLRTPMKVRRAIVYVLQNARRHGLRLAPGTLDPFSSAAWFGGWAVPVEPPPRPPPVHPPRWWDCRSWCHFGPIELDELPAAAT